VVEVVVVVFIVNAAADVGYAVGLLFLSALKFLSPL
jgi:hypothetical protein